MATHIHIKNLPEGYQSIITNGTHSIVGDEPKSSKGTDLGFSPSDLILSGLAMCKVATVRFIARKNNWEIGEVKAHLTQEVKRGTEGLKTTVHVELHIEGNLTDDQRKELFKQADACYIHRQILGEWQINHATEMIAQEVEL